MCRNTKPTKKLFQKNCVFQLKQKFFFKKKMIFSNKQKIDWYEIARTRLDVRNQSQFICNFGVFPFMCDYLFSIIKNVKGIFPIHLLMALYFLKLYPLDNQAAVIWKMTRKTYSKWLWTTLVFLYIHFKNEGSLVYF
jgi:hypothetical protein